MESNSGEKMDYSAWSQENLIQRVTQLEAELKAQNRSLISTPPPPVEKKSWKKPRNERVFDPSKYNTRLIALKLAYLGKRYNGFEHHSNQTTPLPTIEEELWKALNKARLIFPQRANPMSPGEVNWEGCEYSKCGRTDRGVSAFGQVIGIRVRSNRPLPKKKKGAVAEGAEEVEKGPAANEFNTLPRENAVEMASPALAPSRPKSKGLPSESLGLDDPDLEETLNFDPVGQEIPYPSLLNRLLPPDIRILAWCPAPPLDFSARFSCRERRYRYFFTQPAFVPTPHHLEHPSSNSPKVKDGWLDIAAMREAAKMFEGLHDFRNFCKIDAGKQISNFERRMFYADIEEVEDSTNELGFVNGTEFVPSGSLEKVYPKIYTFNLHGSAFLWHQVRCMVSILFLVGQGLEKPSIVSELLDVEKNPRRPTYEMASDTPLVLWDCIFPREDDPERKDAMQWLHVGDGPAAGGAKYGTTGLMDDLWKVWRERKIDEMLAASLVDTVSRQGNRVEELEAGNGKKGSKSQKVFDGGNVPRLQGTYIPVMKKPVMDAVDVINEKYAVRKGFESAEDLKLQGFRRLGKSSGGETPIAEDADE
ncbi:pseudouridine synthase [Hyaloscypha bicolor E]|uniref:Pseudouridine synthase n=1 Tax=Hyaloscypha bicolor E TaxID=1095630 RepID=A0A2J6TFR7_9HELO|nr:pseudouridine synthase [Hyaloscypha bicolor E]PMD61871.1 pseudouridine synthase [Hyaloscypha bicolor E]